MGRNDAVNIDYRSALWSTPVRWSSATVVIRQLVERYNIFDLSYSHYDADISKV